ncbi:MAG TPA: ABC transporter ATP-binding protein [bacterium]|nr:ABC transporter ATP-binding protein [bacterium]
MAEISLRGLTKRFGNVVAVNELTLTFASGELVALLGPSGCGKTTTLRMIAGFETPSHGRVLLGDRDVTEAPPEKRSCGMVFQNYALFPHLTVHQNIAFGLEMQGVRRADIDRMVAEILDKVGLGGLGKRYPRQLSGGQQQRTALARALVINPSVLLLDEPLANLDAKLREEMRFYIRSLQREFHITTLYVTHDQSEALVLADRVAVLMDGVLQQFDAPEIVYRRPRTARVASFIGLTNLIPGRVAARAGDDVVLETSIGRLRARGPEDLGGGMEAVLSIRPENIELGRREAAVAGDGVNRLRGIIRERIFLGSFFDYRVDVGAGTLLRVQGGVHAVHQMADEVTVAFDASSGWTLPGGRG